MFCPKEEIFAQFAEGKLNGEEQSEFLKHLQECSDCSTLYAMTYEQEDNISTSACPDEETFAQYAEEKLSVDDQFKFIEHLRKCFDCSTLYAMTYKQEDNISTSECPNEETFAQYAEGKLSVDEQFKFIEHLQECSDCSTLYAMTYEQEDNISTSECPNEEAFAQYAEGKLSVDEQLKFIKHLRKCSDCSTLYAMTNTQEDNTSTSECPNEEAFAQYAEGKLSVDEQLKFIEHLRECSDCSTLYAMTYGETTTSACPSEESIALFAEGKLSKDQRNAMIRHMAICQKCATEFYLLKKFPPAKKALRIPDKKRPREEEYFYLNLSPWFRIAAVIVILVGVLGSASNFLNSFYTLSFNSLPQYSPWEEPLVGRIADSLNGPVAFALMLLMIVIGFCVFIFIPSIRIRVPYNKIENTTNTESSISPEPAQECSDCPTPCSMSTVANKLINVCPDEESIALFEEGKLSQYKRNAMIRHMAICQTCSTELYLLKEAPPAKEKPPAKEAPFAKETTSTTVIRNPIQPKRTYPNVYKWPKIAAIIVIFAGMIGVAPMVLDILGLKSKTGLGLPWEDALGTLSESLTGPIAFAIGLFMIIFGFCAWFFSWEPLIKSQPAKKAIKKKTTRKYKLVALAAAITLVVGIVGMRQMQRNISFSAPPPPTFRPARAPLLEPVPSPEEVTDGIHKTETGQQRKAPETLYNISPLLTARENTQQRRKLRLRNGDIQARKVPMSSSEDVNGGLIADTSRRQRRELRIRSGDIQAIGVPMWSSEDDKGGLIADTSRRQYRYRELRLRSGDIQARRVPLQSSKDAKGGLIADTPRQQRRKLRFRSEDIQAREVPILSSEDINGGLISRILNLLYKDSDMLTTKRVQASQSDMQSRHNQEAMLFDMIYNAHGSRSLLASNDEDILIILRSNDEDILIILRSIDKGNLIAEKQMLLLDDTISNSLSPQEEEILAKIQSMDKEIKQLETLIQQGDTAVTPRALDTMAMIENQFIEIQMSNDYNQNWMDDNQSGYLQVRIGDYLAEQQIRKWVKQQARKWLNINEEIELRKIEEEAMRLVQKFGAGKHGTPPTLGQTGELVFQYQSYIPNVICCPMRFTEIILQPGEIVTGVFPGDTERWTFTQGESGPAGNEQTHVFVMPLMADISTDLIINTDRRTYNINLISSSEEYMPSVSFSHATDTIASWNTFIADKQKERDTTNLLPEGYKANPEEMHFNYEIRGKDNISWKPIRVWDDGIKTYIQFPSQSIVKSMEAPVFVVFEGRRELLVNYKVVRDMFIVDKVFRKAGLIAGTGREQSRVVITRRK